MNLIATINLRDAPSNKRKSSASSNKELRSGFPKMIGEEVHVKGRVLPNCK
ncbi:hypothetical protein LEP1GSC050_2482 [Leptospira broomii serovar Hurstbridge str. 5399]|uniref:Uncharacterized protein n=1 Tax=Leptospira broomii serovar Hurstbridge str. 5399 TaxID=1049789 RepID=T0F2N0_9LEPT|nr:hypothetical protein LEP1GSC050_2482 [Leptospira broomii serovar Hurstbridge str. 5399]